MENNLTSGIWFCTVLELIFITLKLTENVDWTWTWVLAPFWILWSIVLAIFAVIGVVWLITTAFEVRARNKKLDRDYENMMRGRRMP